jgi:cytochrome c biogenesis protein CcmG, thiol:disulfide interchange protein DsbE
MSPPRQTPKSARRDDRRRGGAREAPPENKVLAAVIAGAIGLSVLIGLAVLPRIAPSQGGMIGQEAPGFALPVVDDKERAARIDLSELRGNAVILDFWASWCIPCQVQAPVLDRLARRYDGRGLVVLGINVDDPPELARSFAEQKSLSYPILLDPDGRAQALYGVHQLPSMVVIDREGKVVAFLTGIVDEGVLDELVVSAM